MTTFFTIVALGFVLGMRHATDPDHVIAVTTILDKAPSIKKASKIGIFWGIGHSLTILVFGSIVILFSIVIPETLSMSLEMGVAIMLIILGLWNLREFQKWFQLYIRKDFNKLNNTKRGKYSIQPQNSDLEDHNLPSKNRYVSTLDANTGTLKKYSKLKSVTIGVIHGFAGTAALTLMIIPLIDNAWVALLYLLLFGLGTIVGMMTITSAIAFPFIYGKGKLSLFNTFNLRILAGIASVIFGLYMFYEIGFAQGLFF